MTRLPGIGPRTAARLAAAGIATLRDLVLLFPRRHDALRHVDEPSAAAAGCLVRMPLRLARARRAWLPGRRSLVTLDFDTAGGTRVEVPLFNQPWSAKAFAAGERRIVQGSLEPHGRGWRLAGGRVLPRAGAAAVEGPVLVRYNPPGGVSEERLRGWIAYVLDHAPLDAWPEPSLPGELAGELGRFPAAVEAMHRPRDAASHEAARRRFALLEAVRLFRRLEARRRSWTARTASVRVAADAPAAPVPFRWTADQESVRAALRARLRGPAPLGALLQGDVGTGKTAVALDAAVAIASAGGQTAFLAPTELLAEQHHAVLAPWLDRAGLRGALLCASLDGAARRATEAALAAGEVDVVVGTHALLSARTAFARLGLVVVDEQQRFGVAQRLAIAGKGDVPHVLVMSATPIPRTVALALFGDLDVLVLCQRPGGRQNAPALHLPRRAWPRVRRTIAAHVRRGGRVYVVCPRIGADGGPGGAVRLHRELAAELPAGLVHGRLPAAERQAVTEAFRRGDIAVLVGTTVLEVGIDVAEATLIVVVGAERFGLATLHQLRGRVGRGARRGLCLLLGERGPRVDLLCRHRDGFALAEADLARRGAGELAGSRQSGALDLRALDPVVDLEILLRARHAVQRGA